jgi:protein-tyrosine phosphatase
MIRILFVCLGNICRSPMAEAVFRHQVAEADLQDVIQVDSAGTGSWHIGKPPHEGTRRILRQKGIDDTGMRARQTRSEDFHQFNYVVAMDASNMSNLHTLAPAVHKAELIRLLDLLPDSKVKDVPDPYYTGNFEEVYELVDAACERLLTYVREKAGV